MDISDDADQCQNPAVDTIIRCSVCDRNLTGIEDVHSVDKDELGIRIEEGLLKSTSPKLTFKIPFVDHQSLVCDKCKSLLDRVRQLMEELEAVRRSLLENLEQKLSVNCRVTDVSGRNWEDCIEDIDSSESEEGSVQLLIDENERKALPINGVSVMPVSQLIQSASWFHRRSSHDGQSVAVFLSPGVSSRTDLHNKSHELGRKGTSCSTCRKTFDTFSDIMAHCEKPCGKNDARKKTSSSSSSSAKEYVCDICSKRFSRKAYLIEHQARHRGTKDRECPICHKWFYSSSYWRHMTLVHPKKDKLVHQCEICHRTFPQAFVLRSHMKSHLSYGDREHVCQICPVGEKKFSTLHQLKNHVAKVHGAENAAHGQVGGSHQLCPLCGTSYQAKGRTSKTLHSCPACSEARLQGDTKFFDNAASDCDLCGKKFSTDEELLLHQSQDHGLFDEAAVDTVDIIAVNTDDVIKDIIVHDSSVAGNVLHQIEPAGQLYSCGSCQKSFPTERQLFGHLRVHDNVVARYTCDVCDKPFKLAKELRRHRRVHTGEKPYRCSYCDKRFSAASNLSEHMTLHTGKMAYQCKICLTKFRLSSTLKKHLNKKVSCKQQSG